MTWPRLEYDLHGADCSYIVSFHAAPAIAAVPYTLASGQDLPVGALVTKMRGKHTAAGWTKLELLEGHAFRYLGQFENLDGPLVLFDWLHQGQRVLRPHEFRAYVPLEAHGRGDLFYTSSAVAGRIVETTEVSWTLPSLTPEPTTATVRGHDLE